MKFGHQTYIFLSVYEIEFEFSVAVIEKWKIKNWNTGIGTEKACVSTTRRPSDTYDMTFNLNSDDGARVQ